MGSSATTECSVFILDVQLGPVNRTTILLVGSSRYRCTGTCAIMQVHMHAPAPDYYTSELQGHAAAFLTTSDLGDLSCSSLHAQELQDHPRIGHDSIHPPLRPSVSNTSWRCLARMPEDYCNILADPTSQPA